ncbi:hypothetical protein ACP4I1_37110 [Streptomyces sp. WG4]|uniref:hypothetical protein n=1 Tax=Streptomyces sp. WG4 TaxID=3417649 RepID=UPI003CFBAE8E
MIQHMSMVFKAGGLSVGEGAFLMACANHTDDKGYVIAHMQQIADEAHMSLRSARDQRRRLEERQLVKAAPRYSPKNKAQLANIFRINLDLLKSMERKRTDYGPTLVEELTFEEGPEENPSSDPPAKSAALLPPSPPPSSLSPVTADADDACGGPSGEGEREAAAPEGAVPEPRTEQPTAGERPADRVARRWAAERRARGVFTSPDRVTALAKEADVLLTKGQPVERLEREVSVMAEHPTWVSLVRHMESVRPATAAAGVPGTRPRGPGEGLSAAARAILAQGSGL